MSPRNSDSDPVFVVGNPKSGTSLLQALLDGHPELYVIPVELQFFKFPRLPSLPPGTMPPAPLPSWKTPIPRNEVSLEGLREEVLSHAELGGLLGSKGEIGRGITIPEGEFDGDAYLSAVRSAKPESLRELYEVLCRSFPVATADRRRSDEYRLTEKCPHQEEYAAELQCWFPDARFLHVLRNPYATLYSNLQGARMKRHVRESCLRHMAKSYYFMERNRRYLHHYRILRYEDVVREPRETMRAVAEFLGISFHPSLMEPTILGCPWKGNARSVDGGLRGIDPRPVDAFRKRIDAFLVAVVNRYFSHLLEEYGYERMEVGALEPWLPLRWEAPWHYWENRRMLRAETL